PGGVVIAEATQRLVGQWFRLQDLGRRELKGIAAPVPIIRVLGEADAESRFAAIRAARLSPFLGREEELALLVDRRKLAAAAHGQLVRLSGEAGMGKSRLAEALRERVGSIDAVRIRWQCSPYHSSSALYPAVQQLRVAAGIAAEDDAATKLDKLAG